jgi:hypothetical protein
MAFSCSAVASGFIALMHAIAFATDCVTVPPFSMVCAAISMEASQMPPVM